MSSRILAAGLFLGCALASSTSHASSGAIGNTCEQFHPVGCYLTTHTDRVTKSVYFFSDGKSACGATVRNCKNGKCGSFNIRLAPSSGGSQAWYTTKKFPSVTQIYTFSFSGRHLGRGIQEDLKFHIRNNDPKTGRQRNTITSYFRASPDGC